MGIWQKSRRTGAPRSEDRVHRSPTAERDEYDPDVPDLPTHPHRHDESLRAIVNRLQRVLENEHPAAPARSIRIPSPVRPVRRTF
jgi:hypothetical protein